MGQPSGVHSPGRMPTACAHRCCPPVPTATSHSAEEKAVMPEGWAPSSSPEASWPCYHRVEWTKLSRQVNELRAQGFGPKGCVKYICLGTLATTYLISVHFFC